MTIVVVSDLHIDDTDQNMGLVESLCDAILIQHPDTLVLNGDIDDPWKAARADIHETDSWDELRRMVTRRYDRGLRTIWIANNHDHGAKPKYLPGCEVMTRYAEGRYVFVHGWEFDGVWNIISPVAFLITTRFPRLMVPIYHLLYGNRTPGQKKAAGASDWTLGVETIHSRARLRAKKEKKIYIIGHTHCPVPFDGLIANAGDLTDRTYVWIDGDKVEMRRF
jgi:UDP-2,3-diacylglucosamine pyrophosphatase LpxH